MKISIAYAHKDGRLKAVMYDAAIFSDGPNGVLSPSSLTVKHIIRSGVVGLTSLDNKRGQETRHSPETVAVVCANFLRTKGHPTCSRLRIESKKSTNLNQ